MMQGLKLTTLAFAAASYVSVAAAWRKPGHEPSSSASRRLSLRGGDEERYSRQVFALGAKAHGLIRSGTVYVDGPIESGMLLECAKNLALSGVGRIVFINDEGDDSCSSTYFTEKFDDLGKAYMNCARAEVEKEGTSYDAKLLTEFVHRLNPSVSVAVAHRSEVTSSDEGTGAILAVERPYSIQKSLNELSRRNNLAFVAVETAGVYGKVFCDFGDDHEVFDSDGEALVSVPLDRVEVNVDSKLIDVHTVDGERHELSKGDIVEFEGLGLHDKEHLFEVVEVLTPTSFSVAYDAETCAENLFSSSKRGPTSIRRVKVPQHVRFDPLPVATELARADMALFSLCDLDKSFDPVRRSAIMSSFKALETFLQEKGALPTRGTADDFELFARRVADDETLCADNKWKGTVRAFAACCMGRLAPIQGFVAAVGSQEVLKSLSGLYNPVHQFVLFDSEELLSEKPPDREGSPKSGLEYILGNEFSRELCETTLFVVGCGAIGCELLKNLAAMQVKKVIVTDMDTIEKSNLSRQLLFRDGDIGKFKSVAASEAIVRFNPNLKVEAHTSKVGEESGPFTEKFWSTRVDVVLNALDNVAARLFIDEKCVDHRKPMVDAGTLGPKGNVQVVVPHQSESYGSSADPPEPAIPVCTLKSFPYSISHTIQWARDLFEASFERHPLEANRFSEELCSGNEQMIRSALHNADRTMLNDMVEDVLAIGGISLASSREEEVASYATRWAVRTALTLFHDEIESLVKEHPADSLDEDGSPFWSGSRRLPKPLTFADGSDSFQTDVRRNLVSFIRSAARLKLETLSSESGATPRSLPTETEIEHEFGEMLAGRPEHSRALLADSLLQLGQVEKMQWLPIEFEKDDDLNGHVEFVTAASNLRALCYGITPVDAMETRRVAGKIIPAMITTTAVVSALSLIELLKLVGGQKISFHRNSFVNVALPFFAFTKPLPAEEVAGIRGNTFTLWDRISVREGKKSAAKGGMSLRQFLRKIGKKAKLEDDFVVSSVSLGPYLIYANFLHDGDSSLLSKPLWTVLQEAISGADEEHLQQAETIEKDFNEKVSVDLGVTVEEKGTLSEFQLPKVRFTRSLS